MGELSISDFEAGSLIFLDEKCFDVEGKSNIVNKARDQSNNLLSSELKAGVVNNLEVNLNSTPKIVKNESKASITLAKDILLDPDGVRHRWENNKGTTKSTPIRLQSASKVLSTISTLFVNSSKLPTKSATKQSFITTSQDDLDLSSVSFDSHLDSNQNSKKVISKRTLPVLRENETNSTSYKADKNIMKGKSRYKLNFLFEKPTSLITIPIDDIKLALNELSMRGSNDAILSRLSRVNELVIDHIIRLSHWIDGENKPPRPLSSSNNQKEYSAFVYPPPPIGPKSKNLWIPEVKTSRWN